MSYLHILEGRLRVRVPDVKRSPARAETLTRQLQSLGGVEQVIANPTTGNVLIYFDADRLESQSIIHHLRSLGYLKRSAAQRGNALGKKLALGLTELAFQRVFAALLL